MMLLKGCTVLVLISCRYSVLCDELKNENTTITNDTASHTNKSALISKKVSQNSTTNRVALKFGRFATEHSLLTKDGYKLKIFRLFSELSTKSPVLLVHGLFQSSDRFLNQNESQSLAYRLQDLGYDVWLFNARGNKYSREHVKFSPERNKTEFFNYSFEEIGCFDLSATVDYILTLTAFKKIHYIGHSLGGTFFLVLNSLVPSYNNKFNKAFLMAPIAYHKEFPHKNLRKEFNDPSKLHTELLKAGTMEIFPYDASEKNVTFAPNNCFGEKTWENICYELNVKTIMGLNSDNNTIFDTRGGSVKTLIHWAQNVKSKKFRRWDSGEKYNDGEYNTGKYALKYPLEDITVSTKIIYAPEDEMVKDTDIKEMAKQMKNAITRKITAPNFKHDDFVAGRNVMKDVYNDIIKDISKNQKTFLKRKTKPIQKLKNEVVSEFPWTSLISVAGTIIFLIIQIVNCCRKKKNTTEEKNTSQEKNTTEEKNTT